MSWKCLTKSVVGAVGLVAATLGLVSLAVWASSKWPFAIAAIGVLVMIAFTTVVLYVNCCDLREDNR